MPLLTEKGTPKAYADSFVVSLGQDMRGEGNRGANGLGLISYSRAHRLLGMLREPCTEPSLDRA